MNVLELVHDLKTISIDADADADADGLPLPSINIAPRTAIGAAARPAPLPLSLPLELDCSAFDRLLPSPAPSLTSLPTSPAPSLTSLRGGLTRSRCSRDLSSIGGDLSEGGRAKRRRVSPDAERNDDWGHFADSQEDKSEAALLWARR